MMDNKQITELAFRLQEAYGLALKEKALDPSTLEELARRMQEIRAGITPEMEFVAAANWLSRTVVIHRVDQTPQPKYRERDKFRIPDVVAIVRYNGHLLPVLIEVKTSKEGKLVWTEEYLQSLQRYATAVDMPLLVAWKYHHVWALTDVRHFDKKSTAYHLDFNTAMKETLMGILLGDSFVHVSDRVRMFIDAEVAEPLPDDSEINIPVGGYTMTIKEAGFTFDGQVTKLEKELFWAFNAAPSRTEVTRIGEQYARIQFIPENQALFSLTLLWQRVALLGHDETNPDWETIMREPVKIEADALRRELSDGVPRIASVFHVSPNTIPDFLLELDHAAS
jgi:Holliday junction resolvase